MCTSQGNQFKKSFPDFENNRHTKCIKHMMDTLSMSTCDFTMKVIFITITDKITSNIEEEKNTSVFDK